MNPVYPVYVISKGRWESRRTVLALERIGVPHRVVVEPQERDAYAAVMDPAKLLVLPFSNLGQGSIPARNWVWEHSISEGHGRHWILDDNIWRFQRFYRSEIIEVRDGSTFRAAELFTDRHSNVAMSGMNYDTWASYMKSNPRLGPFFLNTRIYSCILIKNDVKHRWRGRYNEDTDLSLRVLKDGWCTVLFNAFLCAKTATMTLKGGNTDELYGGDGRLEMARSLQRQHPDVTKVIRRWNRWQHWVDYSGFKQQLCLREGVVVDPAADEFGMRLHGWDVLKQDGAREKP